ncbi:Kappa-B-binding protein-like nuclear factor [Rhynchospora pubera]|uniref:Kappa-B-binding protein-like nuclear factor n=1 Tax=Rhynchospora pubera TaxID=906938 RepID=A0AAV8EMD9_9POAL|nr:Kappa-B-binding protein-like nuclear factor [Rhynchospora pubera]
MAIVKIGNAFRGSPSSHQMYEEEEEIEAQTSSGSSDSESESDQTDTLASVSGSSGSESDSAMGPDEPDLDLTGPVEPGTDLCQVRDQTCTLPTELYNLNGLSEILSVETWNNCLTEEERLALSGLLPDMDHETFINTLSDLFGGKNFHFGSPMTTLFTQLKGGLCEPRLVLYRRGSDFLQKRKYYHDLHNYHISMLGSLMEMKDAWESCKGYTVQEKLRLLDVIKSEKALADAENDKREFESETDSRELEVCLKKDKKSKYGKAVIPEPVRTKVKVKVYGGHSGKMLPDYHDKRLGKMNQSVTVAAFAPHSSENTRKGKHFKKREDLVYPLHQGKIMKAAPLDSRPKVKSLYKNNITEMQSNQRGKMYKQNEETDSDSSEQLAESEEAHKLNYNITKKALQLSLPYKREYSEISREVEPFSAKAKKKSRLSEPAYAEEEVQLVKRVYIPVSSDKVKLPPVESYTLERKRKPIVDPSYNSQQVNGDSDTKISLSKTRDDLIKRKKLANNEGLIRKSTTSYVENLVSGPPLSSCSKKAKGKVNVVDNIVNNNSMQVEKPVDTFGMELGPNKHSKDINMAKKKGKKKPDPVPVIPAEPDLPEKSLPDPEPEPEKPVKKPSILITPTIHTGFSFSIIHLLSAVRKAMISPVEEDGSVTGLGGNVNKEQKPNTPSQTVQDIVNRVKLNPGDPFILETQEPLQDLVRGVLKILSSKTAPLGAKGWKQLVAYEKSNKTWTWVGQVNPVTSDSDPFEEDTSSDAWGIPHKMLVKLVDAFANWLKSGQDTLQQIGSLPTPPASLLSCPDEKERFKDLRAQKSLNTISPSSDEVKAYFRKEEVLRYSIPDRAFSYTAADGKKSTVAPLRRGGGKPTSKARDHFMLKPDRPPHVTILCLVRDAAARLPGSIGTRADVCTLLRDSQYIVEDVSDAQVNQVVSGALDRLHYERDPCVQFDADRKLWVYLHRDREEEDFEDDGTSSTKKWKRPRKDGAEADAAAAVGGSALDPDPSGDTGTKMGAGDTGTRTGASETGTKTGASDTETRIGDGAGASTSSDPPVEKVEKVEIVCENVPPSRKSSAVGLASTTGLTSGKGFGVNTGFGTSTGLSSGAKMLCRENSTNDDFDDEDAGKERLFGAILM